MLSKLRNKSLHAFVKLEREMSTPKIKHIELVIGDKTIKLSPDELKGLRDVINEMYPPDIHPLTTYPIIVERQYPMPFWSEPLPVTEETYRITCNPSATEY